MNRFAHIINQFAIDGDVSDVTPLGDGLINDTYLIKTLSDDNPDYVLQRINTSIFTDIDTLQSNIIKVSNRLCDTRSHRHYLKFIPLKSDITKTYTVDGESAWRISIFIAGSVTRNDVTQQSAYDAGVAFGRFQADLAPIADSLRETIPGFHNLQLRLNQLIDAVETNRAGRLKNVTDMVENILNCSYEMTLGERLLNEGRIPLRVCHCDTKINNMLYSRDDGTVMCIIDLDTVMPSLIYSDYGDFLRTAANTTAEDDPDIDNIAFRHDIFRAFTRGYLSSADKFINDTERATLAYGIARFPYMQAVRFLTDYINGDIYYKIKHPTHNLVRAHNQMKLFKIVSRLRPEFQDYIDTTPRCQAD